MILLLLPLRVVAGGMNSMVEQGGHTHKCNGALRNRALQQLLLRSKEIHSITGGGAWYNGNRRKLSWRAKGTIVGQPDFDSGENSNDGPAKKEIYTYQTKLSAGTYDVRLNYYQEGPYWDADAAIDQNVQFQIPLGE
ncbi:uncharacterized protein N7458_000176 [Penicillium daleae]|uniref:Uncharacterized protein n=1 Tax=Penicillium daleae TaxID=63821 RepID=A0AAD6CG89_9EURO|nr:uncharacterized protein N7458_000176 [Penicillium daleae]KAJ5464490.1 hypothetical protein N7458_000176 [Penicillium daleae]